MSKRKTPITFNGVPITFVNPIEDPKIPIVCPICGSLDVEVTTMGGILGDVRPYDDVNMAKCCGKCRHRGKAGDWQRIFELRAELDQQRTRAEAAEAEVRELRKQLESKP